MGCTESVSDLTHQVSKVPNFPIHHMCDGCSVSWLCDERTTAIEPWIDGFNGEGVSADIDYCQKIREFIEGNLRVGEWVEA